MKIFESALLQSSREADIIDEATDDLTYLGFFQTGDSTKCLIKKIEKVGTVTTIKYPAGSVDFNQNWLQRTALTYLHKR